jgi:acyl-CoA synthetase (AMP-forming)/AMP-acid ligase II/NRPS condensation-like uncharacterized protein/aryl carrier-like protein
VPNLSKRKHPEPAGDAAQQQPFSSLGDLLAFHGRTAPDRDAILAPGRPPLTYRTLSAWSKETVGTLRGVGVGRRDRVAVALPDGPDSAVMMTSVAAGAVCVPLNPRLTGDEWRRYLGELRAAALVTSPDIDSAGRAVAVSIGIPIVDVVAPPHRAGSRLSIAGPTIGSDREDEFASSGDDAFILLTSGSTSRPKMVPLTQAAVCRSAYNVGAVLTLGPQDRLLSVLPLFHGHGLISGIIAALSAGSSVVCSSGFDAETFFGLLTEFRPTWYTAVPTIHQAVLAAAAEHKERARRSSLRVIRSASSTLPPRVVCGLEDLFGVPVLDTFGMTEAATQIAANPVGRRKLGSVGQSAGAEIAILDPEGRTLLPGEHGEIALRGPTITRGYDNDAAATRAAFQNGWFRTGDLGYLDAEGYLFIVGRLKEVINRAGQKIAPAEVEEALLSHPDVSETAVFSVPHERLGADVAAAIVLRPGADLSAQNLRDFARERLAEFKVPGRIQIVPQIPKGSGGKIKRKDLAAAFSMTPPAARRGTPPASELERRLAGIWADLLGFDEIGVDQDVFALGVDSITIMRMLSRLRELFAVDLSLKDIFAAPTVTALAARLESERSSAPASRARPGDVAVPQGDTAHTMSIVQERMLRIEQELPGLPQFNLPFAYRLKGPLNVPALERSLAEVVRRHEALRTGFGWRAGRPVAVVTPANDIGSSLAVEDLAAPSAKHSRVNALLLRKAELKVEQECLVPIDMKQAPLLRARLLRLGADDHVLLLILHDLIIDGWSMRVFMEDLAGLYAAFTAGNEPRLSEPALQFSDFSRWQQQWSAGDAAARQLAYWKKSLRNASPPFTASDVAGELTAPIAHERFDLPNDLVARLSALGHASGATLFMALLAGFKALLMLRTGRNDICVATMMANRSRPGTERTIGPFANTAVIRTRIYADVSFEEALARVRDAVVDAHANQELPFDIIAARLAEEDGLDAASLVQFYFVLQVAARRMVNLLDVTVRPFGHREGQSVVMPVDRTWLRMTLRETLAGVTAACRYKSDLLQPNTVRNWIGDYTSILAHAAANPKQSLGRLVDR